MSTSAEWPARAAEALDAHIPDGWIYVIVAAPQSIANSETPLVIVTSANRPSLRFLLAAAKETAGPSEE